MINAHRTNGLKKLTIYSQSAKNYITMSVTVKDFRQSRQFVSSAQP